MALSDLELLRLTLADEHKQSTDSEVGDDNTTSYNLSHNKIKTDSYQVLVNDVLQTEGESDDYTINLNTGVVTFNTAPESGAEIVVNYEFSAFRDEELTEFLALDGSVQNAAIRCIKILMADAARRFDYTAGQTDIKASQVFANLKELLKTIQESGIGGNIGQTVAFKDRDNRYYKKTSDEETDLSRADL